MEGRDDSCTLLSVDCLKGVEGRGGREAEETGVVVIVKGGERKQEAVKVLV